MRRTKAEEPYDPTKEYPIGKDPSRHYVRIELDGPNFSDSPLEAYLDRNSLAPDEEGMPMYRVEADPRKDAEMRKFSGSSKMVLLSCSKEAAKAWEGQYARNAMAVLRPRKNPQDIGGFEGFTTDTGQVLEADNGGVLVPPTIF